MFYLALGLTPSNQVVPFSLILADSDGRSSSGGQLMEFIIPICGAIIIYHLSRFVQETLEHSWFLLNSFIFASLSLMNFLRYLNSHDKTTSPCLFLNILLF